MSPIRRLTLDANILLRAAFGARVLHLIKLYVDIVILNVPDVAFEEARSHIPLIAMRRGFNPIKAFEILDDLEQKLEIVRRIAYEPYEAQARARIARRDPGDWPILATALLLDCPLWTEDRDFFGTGIATWTTDTIEIYLRPL